MAMLCLLRLLLKARVIVLISEKASARVCVHIHQAVVTIINTFM